MQPLVGYFFGSIALALAKLQRSSKSKTPDPSARDELNNALYTFIGLACAAFLGSVLERGGQTIVAQYLTTRIRNKFYEK